MLESELAPTNLTFLRPYEKNYIFNFESYNGINASFAAKVSRFLDISSQIQISSLKFSMERDSFFPKFQLVRNFIPSLIFHPIPQVQGKVIYCNDAVMCAVVGAVSPFFVVSSKVAMDGSEVMGTTDINFQQINSNVGISLKHEKENLRNLKKSISRVTAVFGNNSNNFGFCLSPIDIDKFKFDMEYKLNFKIGMKLRGSMLVNIVNEGEDVVGNLRLLKKVNNNIKYGLDTSINKKKEMALNLGYCVKLKDTKVRGLISSKKEVSSVFTKKFSNGFSFEVSSNLNYLKNDFSLGFSFDIFK